MRKLLLYLTLITTSIQANSQTITLNECENQFLKNNLQLIAEQYNIDASNANVIQARLWENPYATAELNAYNPVKKQYFDVGSTGQKAFSIEQIIHIGGQKRNEVNLAKSNAKIAELKFEELLRNLRFSLRQSYFSIYYDMKSLASIDMQLQNLEQLISAYQTQADKGNIAPKDVLRLQSLSVNLKNDKILLVNNITENQSVLKLLLGNASEINPQPSPAEELKYWEQKTLNIDTLINMAISNRKDLAIQNLNIEANQYNLKWQRSLGIPDLNVGVSHDQAAGAFPNQTSLTVGIPIPLWNRNQGNIKIAKAYTEQAKTNYTLTEIEVRNEVKSAFDKYNNTIENYKQIDSQIASKYENIYHSMYQNFKKSNISIIEFTDFMESYNQSIIQLNEMKKSIIKASEEINYSTASTII